MEEDRNFATLIDMIGSMQTREDNEDFRNPIDLMFEDLEREKPDCFAVRQYKNSSWRQEMYALSDFLIMVFVMVSEVIT